MDTITIETYDKLAHDYDAETAKFWEQFPKNFLNKFVEFTTSPVLNIGSGPGRDALLLQNHGLDVTCLDASSSMVALAKANGLKVVQADFNNVPFADESFGGVWAYTSLLHSPKSEIKKPLQDTYRVLKPGGTFALGLIEGGEEIYRQSSGMNLPRLFSFFTRTEIETLLAETNFQIIHFE